MRLQCPDPLVILKTVIMTATVVTGVCLSANLANTYTTLQKLKSRSESVAPYFCEHRAITVDSDDVDVLFTKSNAGHICFVTLFGLFLLPSVYATVRNHQVLLLVTATLSVSLWIVRIVVITCGSRDNCVYKATMAFFERTGYEHYDVAGQHFIFEPAAEYAALAFYPLGAFGQLLLWFVIKRNEF